MRNVTKLHPFFLAWFPIVYLGSLNIDEISLRHIIIPCGIITLIVIMLVSCIFLVVRDLSKSLLICSVLLIGGFIYGPLIDAIYVVMPQASDYPEWGVLTILPTLTGFLIYKIYCAPQSVHKINTMLFIIGFTLMLQPTWKLSHVSLKYRLGNYFQKLPDKSYQKNINTTESAIGIYKTDVRLTTKPNVYYIIVDGYPRQDVLQTHYGFSNNRFLKYLDQKGFYVAQNSHSNYPITDYSLASSLNMHHVNEVGFSKGPNKIELFYHLIRKPRVAEQFKALGYDYITISSGWGSTHFKSVLSDYHYIPYYSMIHPFYKIILRMTPFRAFLSTTEAKHSLYSLDKIVEVSKNRKEGAFVFLHLLMPHPPYCFEEDGKIRHYSIDEKFGNKELFVGQLSFLNKKLEMTLDALVKNSEVDPIIILQGDHGTSSLLELNESGPANEEALNERFSILNAYYGSDVLKSKLYPGITPVNSFRLIFSTYFQLDYELLNDSSYFSWYYEDKSFLDITSKLG